MAGVADDPERTVRLTNSKEPLNSNPLYSRYASVENKIELVICFPASPHPEAEGEKSRLPVGMILHIDLSSGIGNRVAANLHTISCVLAEQFTSPRRKLHCMKFCLL